MNMFGKPTKLLVVAALVAGLGTSAMAKKVYKWKLAASWGSTLVPFIDPPRDLAKLVDEMSNGRLKIRVDASNKHKAPLGVLDMVRGNSGMQMGGWFRKEINSIDDFKGLKMRIPGFAGEVLAKAGAVVTNIPSGELYTALERGTIDALEWVSPSMDVNMGFHKIAPLYYTGWHEPGTELEFLINKRKFKKLPKDLQQILITAMRVSAYDMYIKNQYLNAETWAKIKKDYPNIKVKTFPSSVLNELKTINNSLISELEKKSPLMKEILESQKAYQKKAREWSKMSDYLYLKDNL